MSFVESLLSDPGFWGAFLGSVLTGSIALVVYKGNLSSMEQKEKKEQEKNDYKEFRIISNLVNDLLTSLEIIIEQENKDKPDLPKIVTTMTVIVSGDEKYNSLETKNMTYENEIFIFAELFKDDYRFLVDRFKEILDDDKKKAAIVDPGRKDEFKQFILTYKKLIRDTFNHLEKTLKKHNSLFK
ncbi:hypothetical protein [Halobacillus naozhouensis]|uniref:Uncharacterized protein n=1 Tax=Halobacillus naozhouensis TaxID=554880 RepID=A0ABY8J2C9_9BACI|nr:hypothetical protein [Halobacillus naozhouensis]WFT76222.1 hypothetical protein P9989_07625 [Halobacillus naozhouensis]